MQSDPVLFRPRILVVEDHWLVAMEAVRMLEAEGCEVVGPFATVGEAEASVRGSDLEGAILDVNLGGESSLALVRILSDRRIPFAVASGQSAEHLPRGFAAGAYLGKPYSPAMVRRFLVEIGLHEGRFRTAD